jgi:hypothetical protein
MPQPEAEVAMEVVDPLEDICYRAASSGMPPWFVLYLPSLMIAMLLP